MLLANIPFLGPFYLPWSVKPLGIKLCVHFSNKNLISAYLRLLVTAPRKELASELLEGGWWGGVTGSKERGSRQS